MVCRPNDHCVSGEAAVSNSVTRSLFSTVEARGIHRGRGASPVYAVGDQPMAGAAASEAAHQLTRHVVWTPGQPLLTLCSVFLLFSLLSLLTPQSLTLWPALARVVPSLGKISSLGARLWTAYGWSRLAFSRPSIQPCRATHLPHVSTSSTLAGL